MSVTDANGLFQHGRKHRLKIAGGTADNLEHVRRCRLLFQRLSEFVEQPLKGSTAWAAKFCTSDTLHNMRDAVGSPFSAFEASHDERYPEADASLPDGLRRNASA